MVFDMKVGFVHLKNRSIELGKSEWITVESIFELTNGISLKVTIFGSTALNLIIIGSSERLLDD